MQLTPDLLLRAYSVGIFPMAENRYDPYIHWIDPEVRGILPLDSFHVSRKLKRHLLSPDFRTSANQAFAEVIRKCAEKTANRPETWINPTIEKLYVELHELGFAHSIEVWQQTDSGEEDLIGGLYGVALGAAFFGESMFSRTSNASKIALVHLALRLRKGGFSLLDTQFTTPHLRQFGALDIPREHYKNLLAKALKQVAHFPVELTTTELPYWLQRITQEAS